MLQRILTGLILAPLLVALVLWGPKPAMTGVLVAAAAICADELVRMFATTRRGDRLLIAALAALVAATPLLGAAALAVGLSLAICVWLFACLAAPGTVQDGAQRGALGGLALSYVAVLIAMLVAVYQQSAKPEGATFDVGRGSLMAVFVMVFMGDTGAYFAGRIFGRHKLYELVSPKKTVEGGIGGLMASVGGGAILSVWLVPAIPLMHGLLLGALCGAFGQVGDFAESLFKRATGTKDSGTLLPGHGGMLDRVDGVLFAGPVVMAYLLLTGLGAL